MKLSIPVSKWLHGKEDVAKLFGDIPLGSMLYRPQDEKLCCLGHYLQQCGASLDDIREIGEPYELAVSKTLPKEAEWLISRSEVKGFTESSVDAGELMTLNDENPDEEKISEIFAEHGVEVEFIHDEQ